MVGLDSEIDLRKVPEAVDGECGARKQSECEGEFADHENAAKQMLAGTGTCSAALLESLSGIDTRRIPCRSKSGENPGHSGCCKSEKQDRHIEAEISLGRQRIWRHGYDESTQHGISDAYSKGSAAECEKYALRQELGENGGA